MKYNREQLEAESKAQDKIANTTLNKLSESLDDGGKIALKNLRKAIKSCEDHNIPVFTFAKFTNGGFHFWFSLKEKGNEDSFAEDFVSKSWATLGQAFLVCANIFSRMYHIRIRAFSKTGHYLMFDSDPEPEKQFNENTVESLGDLEDKLDELEDSDDSDENKE